MTAKLFTKGDIERAARLAVLYYISGDAPADPEQCVATATRQITEPALPYFSEEEVEHILQFVLQRDDVKKDLEAALQYVRRD